MPCRSGPTHGMFQGDQQALMSLGAKMALDVRHIKKKGGPTISFGWRMNILMTIFFLVKCFRQCFKPKINPCEKF
jgi:hypothetical protein